MRAPSAVATPADPEPAVAQLSVRLRLAVTRLHRRLRQLSPGGATPTLLSALASVERYGPMPLGELAAAEAVSAPTMSRIVDSLEAKGLVGRNPDAEDRRMARIGVTDSGRRMLGGARAQSDQYLAAGLAGLDAAERRRLLWALGVLESLAEPGPSAAPPRQRKAER